MIALRVEAEVDLAVGADGAHEALAALADVERCGEFAAVEKPEAGVVDDGVVAEGRLAGDEEGDFVAGFIGWRRVVDVPFQASGGDDALGLVVDENINDHCVTDSHAPLLLRIRKKQIFSKPPVEERSHARVDFRDLQRGEIADRGKRLARGRDETVFGIAIDENLQHIAGTGAFRNGIPRQQDFSEFPAIQE